MPVTFGFHLTAVPFAVLAVGLAALGLAPALLRGEVVVRLGFAMIAVAALPWALVTTVAACVDGPAPLVPLMRAGFAPIPLVGSGLLIVMLGVAGRVDPHRGTVVASVLLNTGLAVMCAATDTVVQSMQLTDWGLPYPRAGALYGLFVASIPACVGYGAWATRGASVEKLVRSASLRAVLGVGVLAVLAISDVFLTYGVFGVYPVSWLPAIIAAGLSLYAIFAGDVLHRHGVDRGALAEAAVALGVVGGVSALAAITRAAPLLAVATGAGTAAMVAIGRTVSSGDGPAPASLDRKLASLRDALEDAAGDDELAASAAELLSGGGLLVGVRVWFGAGDLALAGAARGAPRLAVPAEVRGFLTREGRALTIGELATARLGALRAPLMAWAAELGAEVLVPLCERDALVGLAVGELPHGRALRDHERRALDELARAVARAYTVLSLRRDIEAQTALSREVELADAVRQARASGGQQRLAGVGVAVAYHPAARVAGDLWFAGELADGRALVLIGDVAGRGTSAALVSAAVVGACQSATGLAAPTASPSSILAAVHAVVRGIDDGRHRVTAAALVITPPTDDAPAQVAIAFAGHRGGYLVREAGDEVELVPLVGRGAPLGEPAWRCSEQAHPLPVGAAVVVVSDGVVEARNRDGAAWGERRLQRALRELGPRGDVADAALAAVDAHVGDARLDDDALIVAIAP